MVNPASRKVLNRTALQGPWLWPDQRYRNLVAFAGFLGEILLELAFLAVVLFGIGGLLALLRDVRPDVGKPGVYFKPFIEAGFSVRLDCLCRTLRFAHAAVNAFVRVNDEHIVAFIETVHRTNFDAIHVFALDAILDDNIGHMLVLKISIVVIVSGLPVNSHVPGEPSSSHLCRSGIE